MTRGNAIATAIISGVAIEVVFAAISDGTEAWDSPAYWMVGLPLGILICGVLGYQAPDGTILYGPLMMGSHFLTMLVFSGGGALLPVGLILIIILSGPAILASAVGATLRRKRDSREQAEFTSLRAAAEDDADSGLGGSGARERS